MAVLKDVKSLQIIDMFSSLVFFDEFFWNYFFQTGVSFYKNYVQIIHCLALMRHNNLILNLVVNLTHV